MIKVLLIGLSKNLGGIETYIYNLVKNADKERFSFDILSVEKEKLAFEEEMIDFGCKIIRVTSRKENYKKHIEELNKVFTNGQYDYFHYGLMSYSWYEPIVVASKYPKTKIIIHSHTASLDKKQSLKTKILHEVGYRKTRKIPYLRVACGEAAGNFMFKGKEFTIFNNGIDLDKFKFSEEGRNAIRDEFKISKDTTVYGLIARLEHQKNVLFLVDIFNEIVKQKENSILMVVGEGSLKEEMLAKAEKYKIKDKVMLIGRREDANKAYSAFDVFLMPSLYEGLSIALVEAQTSGLKCFTSDTVDPKSNITGNVQFFSLNKSAKDWADKILNSDCQRDIEVLKKVPEEFNAKKSYQKVFEYYENNK